jgi:hypothetical protein
MPEREEAPAEATYLVNWDYLGTELLDRVAAETPAEAVRLVHCRQHEPDGVGYSVSSVDGIEQILVRVKDISGSPGCAAVVSSDRL